jgi:hypothetical protein
MEDRDVFDGVNRRAGRDRRGSSGVGILLVEEENPDECFEVFLFDMFAELPD